MRKKLMLTLFAVTLSCALTAGVTVVSADSVSANNAATPQSYGLYTTDTLVSVMGGKKFTPVNPADAVIKFNGTVHNNGMSADQTWTDMQVAQDKNGGPQLNIWSDTAYDYNVGNISSCEGTTMYETASNPEVLFEGYTGGFIGEEFSLADAVSVTDYSAISVEVSYGAFGKANPPALTGSDHVGDAFVFAYGKDAFGNAKTIQSAMTFGIDYWSTGVVELNPAEIATVERVAVLAATQSIDYQGNDVRYIWFTDFTVHAREEGKEEKSMLADEEGLNFYNGVSIFGAFGGTPMKVYRANDVYAALGEFNPGAGVDGANEYVYATQRMSVGSFVTLRLNDPVKVSEYKYLDLELKAWPQIADQSAGKLEETATQFTYSILKYNATSVESEVSFTLDKYLWTVCRIPLEYFADENGYVNSIVIYYSANNRGIEGADESVYTVQTAIHNARLASDERDYSGCKLISQYNHVKAGVTLSNDLTLRFTADIGTDWWNLYAEFTRNGETVAIPGIKTGEGVYVFWGISPDRIGDEVTFTVKAFSTLLINKEHSVILQKTFSVKAYCEAVLASDAQTLGLSEAKFAKLQTLAVDILNYGAAAQVYTGNTSNLVNAGLSDEDKAKATAFDETIEGTFANTPSEDGSIYVSGATLLLNNFVNVGFRVFVDSSVTGEATVQIKIGDGEWTDYGAAVSGATIRVTGLSAKQLSQVVSIRVLLDGTEVASCDYSVYKYIANKCDAKDEQGNYTANAQLARALQCYGRSAAAYYAEQ